MNRRVAVRGIFVHDGKLLCAQAKQYHPRVVTGQWGVPGGGIDDGESLVPALEREITEELGIKPVVGNLLYVQQYKREDGIEDLEFFFYIKNSDEYLDVDLLKTSHGHSEIARLEFIDPAKENILPKFLMAEQYDNLLSQPTKLFSYL